MIGSSVSEAAANLKAGKLVAIPTETVYGLAALIRLDESVVQIFKAKNRPAFDPLIVHVPSLEAAKPYIREVNSEAKKLADAFWPGPLTLLFEKSDQVSDLVSSGLPTVAVRVPQHEITLRLLQALGEPVAAPSANPFGYVSPTTAAHVAQQLGKEVAYILDGGPAKVGLESTIVSCLNNEVKVLRLGGLSLEQLSEVLGYTPELQLSTHSNPQAPGQLDKHYATHTPLYLSDAGLEELKTRMKPGQKWALISLNPLADLPEGCTNYPLSQSGNLDEAASKLFALMRNLDELKLDGIVAERLPDKGLGRAINDRLHRAAYRM
ncbi:MAG: threonylcarbamoyl-AMP synthase [Bacteroidetes bacterium]|nr:MAG: threonylcarbamoyl-AMP synthase [Bacteroidota bacterium]